MSTNMQVTIAIILGSILDCILGDPHSFPHPVRFMGRGIKALERLLYPSVAGSRTKKDVSIKDKGGSAGKIDDRRNKKACLAGFILVFIMVVATLIVSGGIIWIAERIHPLVAMLSRIIMCYQVLAARSLADESHYVKEALLQKDIIQSRKRVAMIVGRDTECLGQTGVIRATVETVAENTSDGVIAPLFYMLLGGPVAGMCYKVINTMDSMLGYKNDKYMYFGRPAAKLDDVVNWIPARISAYAMTMAAFLLPECDGKEAARIHKRDAKKHASPNSAQTESVCAGALGVQLAGDAYYFGKKVHKPVIGDAKREIQVQDITRGVKLMYLAAALVWVIGVGVRLLCMH